MTEECTLRRISNWGVMLPHERENTMRVVALRNNRRRGASQLLLLDVALPAPPAGMSVHCAPTPLLRPPASPSPGWRRARSSRRRGGSRVLCGAKARCDGVLCFNHTQGRLTTTGFTPPDLRL